MKLIELTETQYEKLMADKARARELERANARLQEVLLRVAKEADFSQCPGLEDAVDFVLFGLPNLQGETRRPKGPELFPLLG